MSYGGSQTAIELMAELMAGENITIPEIDFTKPEFQIPGGPDSDVFKTIKSIKNEDLTEGNIDGNGIFDVVMRGIRSQIRNELDAGRISSAEYTKTFVAMTEAGISNSVQFLLGRDAAYWNAIQAQTAAITARIANETAKVQYAALFLEAQTRRAEYALTKLKLATEDATYGQAKFQVDVLLPLQEIGLQWQNKAGEFNVASMLPQQLVLVKEQTEVQRAQTLNSRVDGQTVTGVMGKQKDLYTQQITSYQRDAEVKAGKMFTDAWITMKTMDEGLLPPSNFQNASIDGVMSSIKQRNNLG